MPERDRPYLRELHWIFRADLRVCSAVAFPEVFLAAYPEVCSQILARDGRRLLSLSGTLFSTGGFASISIGSADALASTTATVNDFLNFFATPRS